MKSNRIKDVELVKKEAINELNEIIEKYNNLYEEKDIEHLILQAYTLDKVLTEIEIFKKDIDEVLRYIDELEKFFFVDYLNHSKRNKKFTGVVHITRFLSVLDVVKEFGHLQPYEDYHDLRGILFGYSLKEIAEFCIKNKSNGLIKI